MAGTELIPKTTKLAPRAIEIAAPTAPPAEIPRIYGSAKGLRKTPCKITPEIESKMPIKAANITRGKRICHKISLLKRY